MHLIFTKAREAPGVSTESWLERRGAAPRSSSGTRGAPLAWRVSISQWPGAARAMDGLAFLQETHQQVRTALQPLLQLERTLGKMAEAQSPLEVHLACRFMNSRCLS